MARLLKHPKAADTKLTCGAMNQEEIPVHESIIAARSDVLADMIVPVAEPANNKKNKDNEDEVDEKKHTNNV